MDDVEMMEVDVEMPSAEAQTTSNSVETDVKMVHVNNVEPSELPETRYENRSGTFLTGIDIFSKEEQMKMEERAKRFGLTDKLKKSLTNQEQDLYTSMGITEDNENTKYVRLNVIHMRGTEEMSTKDVFKYFEDYAPASIEWINDVSCNVVWLDNISAARAMLGLSKRIVGLNPAFDGDKHSKGEENETPETNNVTNSGDNVSSMETEDKTDENEIHIKDIKCPLPPGVWRKGNDYPKSKGIFLRFATRADKKQPKAEKLSKYYKKYGNPNFGGIKGILTESRKRMYKQIRQSKRPLESAPEDGNDAKRIKNPWGALSESWGVNDVVENDFVQPTEHKDQGRSVKERLGIRPQVKQDVAAVEDHQSESESGSESEEEWCKKSKVLRMRMHADDEEEKMNKRRAKLRSKIILDRLSKAGDLRSRLGRPKQERQLRDPIQVVVTNTSAMRTKLPDSEEEDGEIVETVETEEKEEGEWQDSNEEDDRIEEIEDEEDEESDDDSDVPAKEVQGPKGSVVKVVQHRPRVASTVWARLNNVKSEVNNVTLANERQSRSRDLRSTLKGGDLRSRIGNHTRGRSPLRIEVKNDKYNVNTSDTE